MRPGGSTVAHQSPVQKVACSNHIGVNYFISFYEQPLTLSQFLYLCLQGNVITRPGGATVARLSPVQKVVCSNHVWVNYFISFFEQPLTLSQFLYLCLQGNVITRPGGATVARLTPVQKVACSNHIWVNYFISFFEQPLTLSQFLYLCMQGNVITRPGGATVARQSPVQKVACSNYVWVNYFISFYEQPLTLSQFLYLCMQGNVITRPYGAMVARLTQVQKVACSNHIWVNYFISFYEQMPLNIISVVISVHARKC